MPTRAEQKEKRREEILMVGLDLFIRKGYTATRIQDIAQEAGMSVGLLFHYFESKEKLYEELIRLGISGPQSVMANPAADPLTFFKETAENILDAVQHHPLTTKMFILMNQALHDESASPAVRDLLSQIDTITQSVSLIKAGQENKTIREGDPYALSIAYWSALNSIAEVIALRPDAPCPDAEWVVDIIRRKPQ